MCDWLVFYPDQEAKVLRIEVVMKKLMEKQPDTVEDTDEFCEEFYTVIDKIQEICITNGYKQSCIANLEGVDVYDINPMVMIRIIWNIYNHTKDCILLQECEVDGGGGFVSTLITTFKGFLPSFMRPMLRINTGDQE
jgi:hypothetical protein